MLWVFSFSIGNQIVGQDIKSDIVSLPDDKLIAEKIIDRLKEDSSLKTNVLLIKVGKLLLETPYVANTLEVGGPEKMVINLRELDCTTFAENCLALARTIQKQHPCFDNFVDELALIRYRDGFRNEYPSRLHYFSDWIFNNDKKGLIKSISKETGSTVFENKVNFMTTHPESYPALKNNPGFIKEIALQESEISNREAWYIPKNKLPDFEQHLQDGDILGITTNIPGMDILHVVIAIRIDGRIHLMHASQSHKKVLISDETLEQYLNSRNSTTGIMVARPL